MKNFEVFKYGEEANSLGDFVGVESTPAGVLVWYVTFDGRLLHSHREDIFLSEVKE